MITRFAIAAIGILVGLAYASAIKDMWDTSIMGLISSTPGATAFEQAIFGAVPIALLVAVFAWGVLLIIKDPPEGKGGGF